MGTWQEKVSAIIGDLLEDLKSRESISGVCLFGSWGRGDAVSSSDIDLLIVDSRDINYEYVERAHIEGYFLDLDYIPERWVLREFPPEVDQKLYEAEILFDRKGRLARAKEMMLKIYSQPERVDLRTMNYLTEADIFLSRGISAHNKGDFQSAKVNAAAGFDAVMKILIELNRLPISNSHFVRSIESSVERFNAPKLLEDYLIISSLSQLDSHDAEDILSSLTIVWREASEFVEANSSTINTLHYKVANNLKYYCKESFWKGMFARALSLIEDSLFAEAVHYMFSTSLNMLENYAWLVSAVEKTRFDFTTILKFLKESKESPDTIYKKTAEAFRVCEVSEQEAEKALRRVKEVTLGIRQKRRELIAGLFS